MDKPLLIICTIYLIFGTIIILSASSVSSVLRYGFNPYHFFIKQVIVIIVTYIFGFIFILNIRTSQYKKYISFALFVLILVMVATLIYGTVINGSRSWVSLLGVTLQPSEFAKLLLIIYLGVFFGNYKENYKGKYSFLIPIIVSIAVFVLVLVQPDLGTSLIIAGIVFITYVFIPFKSKSKASQLKVFAGVLALIIPIAVLSGEKLLTEEQKNRINFRNPCTRYTEETGYQTCNGFIAINGGGLFGRGLGNSIQKYLYLPDSHTDFIMPIAIEELGVVTGIILIIGYIFILKRIINISKSCYKLQNSIICFGIAVFIVLHLLINFGGILALIPLTGIPVPFLSYGGSFTITLICSIFIVERIAIENKEMKRKLEISSI